MHPRGQGAEPRLRAPHPTEQTESRSGGGGPSQSGWRARCRALGLALLLTSPVLASGGCGPLLFLPSAYTPQKVELIYSVQEDITVVRWRITSGDPTDPDLSFQILDQTGAYQPIDFSQSVFPGGGARCGDGTGSCFQYVVRGAYAPPSASRPIRAVHASEGALPGEPATSVTAPTTLDVVAFFSDGNHLVYLNVADSVASDGVYAFPRSYDRTMWPTKGLCVSGSPPDSAQFAPLDLSTGGFPPTDPLTDDGLYCVGLRGIPADGGGSALAQTRVATLPEVAPVHLSYTPPIERSPIIYLIVLDLQIVPERCDSSIQQIEQLVSDTMAGVGVPVTQLPTINLAVDPNAAGGPSSCSQPPQRALQADQLAEAVKQAVSSHPEVHQQFHFFYFNNLSAPLPPSLTTSLTTLFNDLSAAPSGHDLSLLSWLFNPGAAALTGPHWWKTQSWQAVLDDPTLSRTLTSYAQDNLPYTSQIHDPSVPVPFFTDDQVTAYGGGQFKVCNSNLPFSIVDTTEVKQLRGGPSWPIDAGDPPGLLVYLQTPTAVPAPLFVPVGVEADLQVCTRYCTDHPYVATNDNGVTSWATSPFCEATP